MTIVAQPTPRLATDVSSTPALWDERIHVLGGHLLQSWQWGEFKQLHGWETERVFVSAGIRSAQAQVLFRRTGPFSIAYIPRGPALPQDEPALAAELFQAIDLVCKTRRALHLIVEPNERMHIGAQYSDKRFVHGPLHFQPARTIKVPLLDDDDLLAQMHPKTRYSVRLAQRRGVRIERPEPTSEAIAQFYELMIDTSRRNDFGIHQIAYYDDFLRLFGEDAVLLLAHVDEQPAAGLISAKFGHEAIYMYGASSTVHRANGAAFLLQYEAMRWARDAGCLRYDLWGIPLTNPDSFGINGDRIAATRGEDLRGLYRFKAGFGGEEVSYPLTLERRYRPFLSFLARRRYSRHD